jgi:hypothetical protein
MCNRLKGYYLKGRKNMSEVNNENKTWIEVAPGIEISAKPSVTNVSVPENSVLLSDGKELTIPEAQEAIDGGVIEA